MSLDFAVRQDGDVEPRLIFGSGIVADTDDVSDSESDFLVPIVCIVHPDTRMSRRLLSALLVALITPLLIVGSVTVSVVLSDQAAAEASARP